jgi:DNA polymerase III delta prime subunit
VDEVRVEMNAVDFLGSYVRRVIDDEIDDLFAQLPALLLDGPKGVGKTATATQRCRSMRRASRCPTAPPSAFPKQRSTA